MGCFGIYHGLSFIEFPSGKLGKDEITVRIFHNTGLCHGALLVVENELYLRINT